MFLLWFLLQSGYETSSLCDLDLYIGGLQGDSVAYTLSNPHLLSAGDPWRRRDRDHRDARAD